MAEVSPFEESLDYLISARMKDGGGFPGWRLLRHYKEEEKGVIWLSNTIT